MPEEAWNPIVQRSVHQIPLSQIIADDLYRMRAEGSSNWRQLAELLQETETTEFDPVTVVINRPWTDSLILYPLLIDGFDRVRAYREVLDEDALVPCEVLQVVNTAPVERIATYLASTANSHNKSQRPRTNKDKRLAIRTLLEDSEWVTYSDRMIADLINVSHVLVGNVRAELEEKSLIMPVAVRVSGNQRHYQIKDVDTEVAEARLKEVQSILEPFTPKEQEQLIEMAWQIQQERGGGFVSPEAYTQAADDLRSNRVINRSVNGSYASARAEDKLLKTITGVRSHLTPQSRVQALKTLFESPEELRLAAQEAVGLVL